MYFVISYHIHFRLLFEMHSLWPQSATFKDSKDLDFEEYKEVVDEPIALDIIKTRLDKSNPDEVAHMDLLFGINALFEMRFNAL